MVYYDIHEKIGPRDQKYKVIFRTERCFYDCTGRETVIYNLELENGRGVSVNKKTLKKMQKRNFLKNYHKKLNKRMKGYANLKNEEEDI